MFEMWTEAVCRRLRPCVAACSCRCHSGQNENIIFNRILRNNCCRCLLTLVCFVFVFADISDDCYPAISLKLSGGQQNCRDTSSPIIMIKDEPMSECDSPPSSCPPSPTPSVAPTMHRNRLEKRVSIAKSNLKSV